MVSNVDFMTLNSAKFRIPWIHHKLEGTITKFVGKHQFHVIVYHIFNNKNRQLVFQYHLVAHHLHHLLKYVDFSWKHLCQH